MPSIQEQTHLFLITVLTGVALGLLYDGFRIFRKAIPHFDLITNIEDLLYWILVAISIFYILFNKNYGEIRGFAFLGAILGVMLYFLVCSPWIMKISDMIIKVISKGIGLLIRIVTLPFRFMYRIFGKPCKKVKRKITRDIKKNFKAIQVRMKKI